MSTKHSLKRSLVIGLTLGVTLLWLLGAVASGLVVRNEMNEAFDKALKRSTQHILPLIMTDILNRDDGMEGPNIPILQDDDEYLRYLVLDRQGNILLISENTDLQAFDRPPILGFSNSATHRIYTTSALNNRVYIEAAEPLAHRNEDLMEAIVALLLPLLVLAPISLLGIWWIIRLSLRKVIVFQHSIEARGAGDLSSVEMTRLPEEFKPIAIAINRLLERMRRTLDAERSFTANSAHELRTPLATALAKVQRVKGVIKDEQLKQQIADVEASLHSLSRQSEKLLELAKAEGGGALSQQPHNLTPILAMIAGDFTRREPKSIHLSLPENEINSRLDPDAFAILARNLIENALKHGRGNQPIDVYLSQDGTLRVVNDCDLVPPKDIALLRNRFVRSNTTATGSGLGLAIVDAITTGAGISLHLRSPATGQTDGFEAELNVYPSTNR